MYPYTVSNHEDLYFTLIAIHSFEKFMQEQCQTNEALIDKIIEMKRAARKYMRKQRELPETRLVRNDGIDGCIILQPLPERITDRKTAKEYFEDNEYIHYHDRGYDCTGQCFTSWYKIINRNGRYYAYHSISRDC